MNAQEQMAIVNKYSVSAGTHKLVGAMTLLFCMFFIAQLATYDQNNQLLTTSIAIVEDLLVLLIITIAHKRRTFSGLGGHFTMLTVAGLITILPYQFHFTLMQTAGVLATLTGVYAVWLLWRVRRA